jgi:effector-associated domain 1 (EAD1)-containing protein
MPDLNFDLGLRRLWAALDNLPSGPERFERLAQFATLEARLHQSVSEERMFGTSEGLRAERARILHSLNGLSLVFLDASFTDLCRLTESPRKPAGPETMVGPVEAPPPNGGGAGAKARLTCEDLQREGYVYALAELFNRDLEVKSVLAEARIASAMLPPFGNHTPLQYWGSVCAELDKGLIENGFEALLRAAARFYPYHRLLRRWAG